MPFAEFLRTLKLFLVLAIAAWFAAPSPQAVAQVSVSASNGPYATPPAPIVRQAPEANAADQKSPQTAALAPLSNYDPALFQKRMPKDELAFLNQFAGASSGELYKGKQFRKLMKNFVPDCTFHFGVDLSLTSALDQVLQGSSDPVMIRDGRYLLLSGHMATHHYGKGFLWIDLREGIGLGGFYFRPGNGEPTPTVNVFSRQVTKEMLLDWSELPPEFAQDEVEWARQENIAPLTTRYFITGSNKKILLEHDEDFCVPASGAGYNNCEQMNADASDLDLTAASYLEQTHHVTNATAWMISDPDLASWIGVRDRTCGGVLDPIGCHVTMTRERTHIILHAPPPPRSPAHPVSTASSHGSAH